MALPTNALQTVVTYQMSGLAFLQNLNCFVSTANTKFKDFDKLEANLGDTVGFDLPPRYVTNPTLVAVFQGSTQRVQTLKVDQAINTAYAFSSQQLIFNVHDYMGQFGKAAIREIGAKIEANVARNCVTGPYRFFGDGITPINSYNQLAQAVAQFHEFGAAPGELKGYLSNLAVAAIVSSGLNQFVPNRNDRIAMSWEVGEFDNTVWYRSNLLPIHTAGSVGQAQASFTITALTIVDGEVVGATGLVSGAPGVDADAFKLHDKLQFDDGVAGQPNMRFLTFVGHEPSGAPVQVRLLSNAATDAGSLATISFTPPLVSDVTKPAANVTAAPAIDMVLTTLTSHRAGMITSGEPLYLGMPRLPDQSPFLTGNEVDMETGVSIRQTYGTVFGENEQGFVHDAIWGSTLVPDYAMCLVFPL